MTDTACIGRAPSAVLSHARVAENCGFLSEHEQPGDPAAIFPGNPPAALRSSTPTRVGLAASGW